MTAFQKYLWEKYGTSEVNGLAVDRRIVLAAALDRLLTEQGYTYVFDEEQFKFTLHTAYSEMDTVTFTAHFAISSQHIIVAVCPEVAIAVTYADAVKEVVRVFRNALETGVFGVGDHHQLVFFACTDWYATKNDVPDKRFLHYLLTLPMYVWLKYLPTVMKVAEGLTDAETAVLEILRTDAPASAAAEE